MRETTESKNKPSENLYKIGLFSQMNKVTVKALRHYDEIGLLKPAHVDEWNGYRYYTSKQLPVLHEILSLRQLGLTLEEIGRVQQGESVADLLVKKKAELLKSIAESTMKLSQVEYYLLHKRQRLDYKIVLKEIPEVIAASMRTTIEDYHVLFDMMPLMGQEMDRIGCTRTVPQYCFSIYHDGEYKEEEVDVEICEAVEECKIGSDKLSFKKLERVEQAACVLHRGAYEGLPKAYAELMKWIESNSFELHDKPRESYIDGVWNKASVEEWLTEIQFPVRKK